MHSCTIDVSRCRTGDCSTHIARERVKEAAVLLILKAFINLVLPEYTTGAHEVDKAEEMGTSGTVCYQHEGALQATI